VSTPRGAYSIQSLVTWDEEYVVGEAAEAFAGKSPISVISDLKRLIGRPFDHPEIQRWKRFWPFELEGTKKGGIRILLHHNGTVYRRRHLELLWAFLCDFGRRVHEDFGKETSGIVYSFPAWVWDADPVNP
jgi:molecular chaperone DnaK (HSP70)